LEKVHCYHVDTLTTALADVEPRRRAALAGAVTELVRRLHREDAATRRTA
jgi:hypothetical protein